MIKAIKKLMIVLEVRMFLFIMVINQLFYNLSNLKYKGNFLCATRSLKL